MIRQTCSSGWVHAYEHVGTTNWTDELTKERGKKGHKVGRKWEKEVGLREIGRSYIMAHV